MKPRARMLALGLPIFSLIYGCQASLNADASADASGKANAQAEADAQLEGQGDMRRDPNAPAGNIVSSSLMDSPPASRVLLGARHDLRLRPGKGTASCECLSVALGGSRSTGMLWTAAPPDVDESTQLTIALSSEGTTCKGEPKGSLGASYWGYRISGNDVVVLVESARGGHPLTSGAVIPRPVGSGQVYVKPAAKKLPYGRALDGKGMCKIGNPGQARTSGFTELELGVTAPAAPTRSQSDAVEGGIDDVPTTIEMPAN